MNKICTDIEQSKKLLELGIDVKTADMFWDTLFAKKPEAQVNNHHFIDEYDDEHRVPAWSLSALLDILSEQSFIIKTIKNEFNIDIPIRHCKIWFSSLLDAAFEMVVWLLENKK